MNKKIAVCVPLRLNSTRLPNKLILPIKHVSMIEHVYGFLSQFNEVDTYLIYDDVKIINSIKYNPSLAKMAKENSILVSENVPSGTDRIALAVKSHRSLLNYDFIINYQGDMPVCNDKDFTNFIHCVKQLQNDDILTAGKLTSNDHISNRNFVKIIGDIESNNIGLCRWFSRHPHQYDDNNFIKHLGIYAYSPDTLLKISRLNQTRYEVHESLEQLRFLENDYKIKFTMFYNDVLSVDTQEDLDIVESYL